MKKLLSSLLALILTMSVALTGCQSSPEVTENMENDTEAMETGEVIELDFWTLSYREKSLSILTEEFNQANPGINVTVSYFDTDGIKDAGKVAAVSGTLPNMWFTWGGSLGGFYADNDLVYDLGPFAEANNWDEIFLPGALELCNLNGQLSGYPTAFNVIAVYYRKDIFAEYGLEVPTTFEEFEAVCATLEENDVIPLSTAGLNGWHVMRFVELLVEKYAGADLHNELNTFNASWDNEKVVEALAKYKEFAAKGYLPEGFVTADPNDTNMAVFSGQAAMDIQGQWYDGMIVGDEQNMDNYGVFSLPTSGTNRMSAFAEMVQFNVNNTDEELAAGMKFLDYYYDEANVERFSAEYSLPLPKIDAEMPEGQPNVAAIMGLTSETGTFTITDQAFPAEVVTGLFDVQSALVTSDMTPEEGAKQIQEAIERYLSAKE